MAESDQDVDPDSIGTLGPIRGNDILEYELTLPFMLVDDLDEVFAGMTWPYRRAKWPRRSRKPVTLPAMQEPIKRAA